MGRIYRLTDRIWVGDYPWSETVVKDLTTQGVHCFVSLVKPGETDRKGQPLPDYKEWLGQVSAMSLTWKGLLTDKSFQTFSDEVDLLIEMSQAMPLYLHCRSGKNRSGTYAAAIISRLNPTWSMYRVLDYLNNTLRTNTTPYVNVPSEGPSELMDYLYEWHYYNRRLTSGGH